MHCSNARGIEAMPANPDAASIVLAGIVSMPFRRSHGRANGSTNDQRCRVLPSFTGLSSTYRSRSRMLLMLEDNSERIERFTATLRRIKADLPLRVWRDAHTMLREAGPWLASA